MSPSDSAYCPFCGCGFYRPKDKRGHYCSMMQCNSCGGRGWNFAPDLDDCAMCDGTGMKAEAREWVAT